MTNNPDIIFWVIDGKCHLESGDGVIVPCYDTGFMGNRPLPEDGIYGFYAHTNKVAKIVRESDTITEDIEDGTR